MRSLPFNAQMTRNLFAVKDEQGAEAWSLYGTPGLELTATASASPGRGAFAASSNRAFMVIGNTAYEVSESGSLTSLGTLLTDYGNVSFSENGNQLGLCDGTNFYLFDYGTSVFTRITSGLPATVAYISSLGGYFIAVEGDSGRFFFSGLRDGTSWDALDFATAESSSDDLLAVGRSSGQLFLFGANTFEVWSNTGTAATPFERVSGAIGDVGILAPHTLISVDSSLLWVGRDTYGECIVYRMSGFRPQRISTEAIEYALSRVVDHEELKAFAYQEEGHLFYCITGSDLPSTLCFDAATQMWHERTWLNDSGEAEQHLVAGCAFAHNKLWACSRRDGSVYHMSMDIYTDNGREISRERILPHIVDDRRKVCYHRLEIGVESGVGNLTEPGLNPKISLRLSRDGARSWSDWIDAEIGARGQYQTKAVFRRLGSANQMTFHLRITDPVKTVLTGCYVELT
jgi:hypothetical protein